MQVEFSKDGNYLYTGARRDTDIFCWDIRYTSDVVYRLQRDSADTNQRIQFDIEPLGRHLATGGHWSPYYFSKLTIRNMAAAVYEEAEHITEPYSSW